MKKIDLAWKFAYLVIAGGVFLIDQTTKAWAAANLRHAGDRSLIEGFLSLSYAQNTGIAFSMLDEHGDTGRWGLSLVAFIAATLVIYFLWRTPRTDDRLLGGLALLLAGIAGNVTDRIRLGYVIDFIDVKFGAWHYPTFNVADVAICVGAGILLIDVMLAKRQQAAEKRTAAH